MARYRFKQWSDGNTQQQRELTNVQADINLSAEFQQIFRVTLNGVQNKGKVAVNNSPFTYSQYADLDAGTSCTLKAQPDTGYLFSQWSDGNTDQTRTISSLSDDITLSAEFTENVHDVRLYVEDNIGGKVKIDSGTPGLQAYLQVLDGDSCQISAIPDAGYAFQEWSDGDTNAVRTLSNIDDDITLEATFVAASTHTVSLSVNDPTYGHVQAGDAAEGETSSKTVNDGDTIVIKAIALTGGTFLRWSDANTNPTRTITNVTSDITLIAVFSGAGPEQVHIKAQVAGGLTSDQATVKVGSNPEGTTSEGDFDKGSNVQIQAFPKTGYIFSQWGDGNKSNPRMLQNVQGGNTYWAMFESTEGKRHLQIHGEAALVMQVGTQQYRREVDLWFDEGASVIVDIPGYSNLHVQWSDGSTESYRTIVMDDDVELHCNLVANSGYVKVSVDLNSQIGNVGIDTDPLSVFPKAKGVVSGSQVTLKAVPNAGALFTEWEDGSTDATRVIPSATSTIDAIAFFAPNPNVKVISLYGEFGKGDVKAGSSTAGQSSSCEVTTGGDVQIQAIAKSGYAFQKWSDDNTEATRTLTNVQSNITLNATFVAASTKTVSWEKSVVNVGSFQAKDMIMYINGSEVGSGVASGTINLTIGSTVEVKLLKGTMPSSKTTYIIVDSDIKATGSSDDAELSYSFEVTSSTNEIMVECMGSF